MHSFILLPLALLPLCQHARSAPVTGTVDCGKFTVTNKDASVQCVLDTTISYPESISGIGVSTYHYTDNFLPTPAEQRMLELIPVVAQDVLPTYSTFTQSFDVTLMLVPQLNNLGETLSAKPDYFQCYTRIRTPVAGLSDTSLEQLVAHELYHCVQFRERGWVFNPIATQWWLDGSADYFAEFFYPSNPTTTAWNPHIRSYDPTLPLYTQAYDASTFFLALHNQGWTNDKINSWVKQHPQTADLAGERANLANSPKICAAFPVFAQQFFDAKLTDSTQTKIDLFNPITAKVFASPLASDGAQSTEPFKIKPWTLNAYSTTLDEGLAATLDFTSKDSTALLQYQVDGGDWQSLTPDSQASISTECGAGAVTYNFLLTSTAADEFVSGQILLQRNSAQECTTCGGTGSRRRRDSSTSNCGCTDAGVTLDPCLLGSWTLDDASLQATLLAAEEQTGLTIDSVTVTGASTFVLTAPDQNIMTFDNMDINIEAESEGLVLDTDSLITGSLSARLVMQGAGVFCWTDGTATGEATVTLPILGTTTWPLDQGYGMPTTRVKYTCDAQTLTLSGYDNGTVSWNYVYMKNGS